MKVWLWDEATKRWDELCECKTGRAVVSITGALKLRYPDHYVYAGTSAPEWAPAKVLPMRMAR